MKLIYFREDDTAYILQPSQKLFTLTSGNGVANGTID